MNMLEVGLYTVLFASGLLIVMVAMYTIYIHAKEHIDDFLYKKRYKRERLEEDQRRKEVESLVHDIIQDLDGLDKDSVKVSVAAYITRSNYYICIYKIKDEAIVFPAVLSFDLQVDNIDHLETKQKMRIKILNEYVIPNQVKRFLLTNE